MSGRHIQPLPFSLSPRSPRTNKNPPFTTHLVEIKHQVQLAHIPKKAIQHLHEEVYGLQIRQFVVVGVHANTEEQARVPPVDDFEGAEFDEVGLVFLVAGGDEAVDL